MGTFDPETLESLAEGSRQIAAEALNVDVSRITSEVNADADEESIYISWKLDGEEPTELQVQIITNYMEILAHATSKPNDGTLN